MASLNFKPEYGDGSATGSTLSNEQETSMDNGKLGENVMPMELAIKREIAYRMKMDKLQARPGAGMPSRSQLFVFILRCKKWSTWTTRTLPLITLAVLGRGIQRHQSFFLCLVRNLRTVNYVKITSDKVPSPSQLGVKRKASSSNQWSSMQQPPSSYNARPPDNLYCKVCDLGCSSAQCLKQHRQGSRHKANLEAFVESQKRRDSGNRQQWCKVCRVPCSDEKAYAQHLAGKKHAAVVSARTAQKKAEREVSKIKWDELEWETV